MAELAYWDWAQRNRRYLKAIAARVLDFQCGGAIDASDVVQEALETAGHGGFRGQSLPEWQAYLCQIVRYKALKIKESLGTIKRDVLRTESLDADERAAQLPANVSSPSSQAAQRELAARALAALDQLEPIDRDALRWWLFDGLEHEQIAERLDITPAASRQLRHRAVERLRAVFGVEP